MKLGADLCSFADHEYLVIADYLISSFIEVDRLEKTTLGAEIRVLEKQFSRHGIPDKLISDNGPQFVSKAFEEFAQTGNSHTPHQARDIRRAMDRQRVRSK